MSFASGFRRLLTGYSSAPSLQSPQSFPLSRFYATLTSPKLFVSGLSRLTTDETLRDAFSPHGQLVEARVIIDRQIGKSKGFGFVTYATIQEAEKAREAMNAKMLDGWVIFVDPARPKGPRPSDASYSQLQTSSNSLKTNKTVG